MLLRPTLLVTSLGIGDAAGPSTRWLPRLIAVREIALGTGLAASSRNDGSPYVGLITLSLLDAGEAVILLLALNNHEVARDRGRAFIAADAGSALAGAGALTGLHKTQVRAGKLR